MAVIRWAQKKTGRLVRGERASQSEGNPGGLPGPIGRVLAVRKGVTNDAGLNSQNRDLAIFYYALSDQGNSP